MSDRFHSSEKGPAAAFGHLTLHSPESVDYRLEIAGIGARSHAFVIDWHIRLLLALAWILALGLVFFMLLNIRVKNWEDLSTSLLMIWFLPAGIVFFLYHPVLEIAMSGRTPGKRMAGVRLVTLRGQTPGTGALLLRNVFRLVDSLPGFYGVGLACVALTKHQVRIGDLASGLLLVYDRKVSAKELQRAAELALHSHLQPDDQTLLLDLLERWPHFDDDVRIRLGSKFLIRIGQAVPENIAKKSLLSWEIRKCLERLTEGRA
ncbi:MAG: RDD family protein [Gammaproteobacteria bacterium]